MDPTPYFFQLATLRQQMNCPPAGTEAGNRHTMAILLIGGQTVYGMNSMSAGMPREYRQFMNDLALAEQNRNFPLKEKGHLAHAEGDALIQAWNASITNTHRTGHLFVDRPMCDFCNKSGGIARLLSIIGMEWVEAYELIRPPAHHNVVRITPRG